MQAAMRAKSIDQCLEQAESSTLSDERQRHWGIRPVVRVRIAIRAASISRAGTRTATGI